MMSRLPFVLAAFLTLGALPPRPAAAAETVTGNGAGPVVNCYDASRETVSHELSGDCKGVVVTPEQAEEIKARRSQRTRAVLYERPPPLYADRKLTGIGTGFFVTDDGKLLTNHHVVEACAGVSVELAAGGSVRGKVLAVDEGRDLALIQGEIAAPATARFANAATPVVGQPVATVGYPNQGMAPVRPSITDGDAMGTSGAFAANTQYMINADIRRGNSGGPVLDQSGRVVGIIRAKFDTVKMYKKTGHLVDNVGVAIANQVVLDFLQLHHIGVQTGPAGTPLSSAQLFEMAKPFIARVGCWN